MNTKTQSLKHRNKSCQTKGFSLIEILVILAIVGILAGISGTALMKWVPQANLKRAARTIVSMCQDARVEALKRNQAMTVNCDNTENSCIVLFTNGTEHRRFNLSTLRSGVQLTDSFRATFTGRGRAVDILGDNIHITNNAASTLSVTVRTSGSIITN